MDLYDQAYAYCYQQERIALKQKLTCWACGEPTNNYSGGPEGQPVCDNCHDNIDY